MERFVLDFFFYSNRFIFVEKHKRIWYVQIYLYMRGALEIIHCNYSHVHSLVVTVRVPSKD